MFGQRLERARKAMGLSLRGLGDKVGLSQTAISKYEKNQINPDSTMLMKFAKELGVKVEYFLRPEKFTLSLSGIDYRKKELTKKNMELINSQVLNKVEKRFELESFFPQKPIEEFFLPTNLFSDTLHSAEDIEEISNKLRISWNLGFSPIPDLIDVLESKGIRVFVIDDSMDNNFDGLATKVNGQPIIVICSDWTGDRQRFTLAHELGHLVFNGKKINCYNGDEEKAANHFAGAFLLPEEAIKDELGERRNFIEMNEFFLIKHEYGASMQVAMMRAKQVGIITNKQSGIFWTMFKKNGWLVKEPGKQYPAEESHVFEQLVFHALAEEFIGEAKAAELMDMNIHDFYKLRMMDGE